MTGGVLRHHEQYEAECFADASFDEVALAPQLAHHLGITVAD